MASAAQSGETSGASAAMLRDEPEFVAKSYPLLILGVMLASLVQLLDTTITIVAIPHMQASLSATAETITWVLTSYIIASAVAMPITGWLAGQIGAKRLLLWSVSGFIIASMLCGMAQNLGEMVIFRALQGVAGAFIMPLGQSAMLDATRPSRRAQIMTVWGVGVVMGPVLGPILGGLLTENWNWRWVFYVNLPLGALALALIATQLPKRERRERPFDLAGFAFIGIALASLQLLLDRGPRLDWFDSMEIWAYAAVSISSAWMALIQSMTARHPLFDRALFRDVNLITAMCFIFVAGAILFSSMALLPNLLQNVIGYGVVETGMMLAMRGIGVMFSMQVAGFLLRLGADTRMMIGTGFSITALSLYMMTRWNLDITPWDVAVPGLVQGLGIGLVFIPLNTSAFATLPPHLRTDASSLMNLFRSIGSSLGIAILTAILARNVQVAHNDLGANITATSVSMIDLSALDRFNRLGSAALAVADGMINRQAAMIAYIDDFWAMMWLTCLVIPLVLLIRTPPPHLMGRR